MSPRSVSISPYLARRPSPVTRAPVSRWPKIGGNRPAQIRPARLDPRQPPALEHAFQSAHRGFDFGKFGHAPRYGEAGATSLEAAPHDRRSISATSWSALKKRPRRVGGVFSSVARRYDLMNDLMSGGAHRLWKNRFVARVKPRAGEAILDMAGGTGDVAFRMARRGAQVTVADINADMLDRRHGARQGSAASTASSGRSRMPRN